MPYSTLPTILDEVKKISITNLKMVGLFEPGTVKTGQLNWTCGGEKVGSVNILVDMKDSPHAWLNYTYNHEQKVNYKVKLVSDASNLGVGRVWYFICPHTGKRCRKLYGAGTYFLHRDAYPEALYECQTLSKKSRHMQKCFGAEELQSELKSKHFKSHYAGKQTKRYKNIIKRLETIRQKEIQALKMMQRELKI